MAEIEYFAEEDYVNFSEFPLAVTLICLGQKLVALNRDPKTPDKVEFAFEKSELAQDLVTKYWNGELLVEPKAFWNISRELKSRIRLMK